MFNLKRVFEQILILSVMKHNDDLTFIKDLDESDGKKVIFVAPKNGIYTVRKLSDFVTEIAKNYFPSFQITLPYKTKEGNFMFGNIEDFEQSIKIVIVPDPRVLTIMEERNYVTISCFSVFMYGFFQNVATHFLEH